MLGPTPDTGEGVSGKQRKVLLPLPPRRLHGPNPPTRQRERVFIELMTSDRKLEASREGTICPPWTVSSDELFDGSDAVHTVLPWESFDDYEVPP